MQKFLRIVKFGSIATVVGGTAIAIHRNDYHLRTIGVVRFCRAGVVASRIFFDYKYSLYGLKPDSDNYAMVKSATHKRSALKLLELAKRNGGVWIKVGQHVGALDYLLPPEYVKTLSVLHARAPESSFEDICRVIKEDLKTNVSEMFLELEEKSYGAASLAQVHKARLHDGTYVAVKVQHLHVKSHSFIDMKTMEFFVKIAAKLFPEFKLLWLAEEMKKNLPIELDFINEGRNTEKVGVMFSNFKFLKIPKIYWEYSSGRILTMEFCEGGFVNDRKYLLQHKIDPSEVCKLLGKLYSDMIFRKGFVHCDPHPGNVLVHKHPKNGLQLVLLDHGLYANLTEEFRMQYANLWLSLMHANLDGIQRWSKALGVGDLYGIFACMVTARSWKSVSSGIYKSKPTAEEGDEIKQYAATYLCEISEVLDRIPRPLLLVLKTNDLLRGIEYSLNTQHNAYSFVNMSRSCVKTVYEYKRLQCTNSLSKLRSRTIETWELFKIAVYEVLLDVREFFRRFRRPVVIDTESANSLTA